MPLSRHSCVCINAAILIGTLLIPSSASAHGEIHERIKNATLAIERDSTNARLYLLRAELHSEHLDYPAANDDVDRAERLDPNLAAVDLSRARLLAHFSQMAAARTNYDRYLKRVPDDGNALVERARLFVRLNQRKLAVADFNRALTILREPGPDVYLDRAKTQIAEGQSEAALRGLDEGIKALGPIVALQLYAIELELARTNYDSAVRRVDTITSQSARKESWLVKRAEILQRAGKKTEARESYQSALDAIHALPPRLQGSESVIELGQQIGRALKDVTNAPANTKR